VIVLFLALLLTAKATAQDIHFSQFPYSPLNLSAAQTGHFDGDLRLNALHRRQWASVTVPYRTFSAGADGKLGAVRAGLERWGAGFLFNQDIAGDGDFQVLQAELSFSYTQPLGSDSIHFLRGGLSIGMMQKKINFNKLNFDAQYDGFNFNPLLSSGESPERTHFSTFDAGGALGWTAYTNAVQWNLDVQMGHLNQPRQQFLSSENVRLPMIIAISTHNYYYVNDHVTLLPSAAILLQKKFKEINLGAETKLFVKDEPAKKYAVGIGMYYRSADAVIPMLAVYWNKFRVGVSDDINISSLNKASNGRGGPEISITYISKKIRAITQHTTVCPVY
jgi:type IX secretion system PorP/SprF family membrane protein